ncbi:MAG: acetyl-CoA carboxylase, biotin carboxyl carrier protein, partial [Proteobacteria bacterium]
MDEEVIRDLARLLDETNLSEIEIEQDGTRIRV